MIKVNHPNERHNRAQQQMLEECEPGPRRRLMELEFQISNIIYSYHYENRPLSKLAARIWHQWLETLDEKLREEMTQLGFEKGCKELNFLFYVIDYDKQAMQDYRAKHLSAEEEREYQILTERLSVS